MSAGPEDATDTSSADRWLADLRADADRRKRRQVSWGLQHDAEDATVVGALVDLAEGAAEVMLHTVVGRRQGALVAVGPDLVVLRDTRSLVLIALDAIGAFGTRHHSGAITGRREAPLDLTLAEALHELSSTRRSIAVRLRDGTRLVGRLRSVGVDVAALVVEGPSADVIGVGLAHVAEVVVE